jgi:hypothetical protein
MRQRKSHTKTRSIMLGLLASVVLPATSFAQGVIRGLVVEAGTSRPVSAAFVDLVDGVSRISSTMTDSAGAFTLRTPKSGDAVLTVSRIGYNAVKRTVKLSARDGTLPPITLQPDAVPMDAVVATVETGVLEDRLKGLMHRRQLGAGYFMNEQRLKAAAGAPLSDVLRGVPGISVSSAKSVYGPLIYTNANQIQNQLSPFRRGRVPNSQMQIGPCPMQLFIDGKHFSTQDLGIDIINPQDLIAVEVFRTIAEVPAEFGGLHARCGVVSVWTRRVPSER